MENKKLVFEDDDLQKLWDGEQTKRKKLLETRFSKERVKSFQNGRLLLDPLMIQILSFVPFRELVVIRETCAVWQFDYCASDSILWKILFWRKLNKRIFKHEVSKVFPFVDSHKGFTLPHGPFLDRQEGILRK
jgi:hypothetical protein